MQENMKACEASTTQAVEKATVTKITEAIANWAKIIHNHADTAEAMADRLGNGVSAALGESCKEPAPPPYGLIGAGIENLDEMRRAERRLDAALARISEAIG
ncbi:hypothetical protein [Methyloceanibacter caenitepidi]|uniref:Uncharacterized protein n=1 Tax=Methyloceanibacter caenitepidi TaxID=1384459 RepID=A0A0A8K0N3_9HYPH|nr:hypothetical protein [Methyloceanibacter caenitepidi]BAQ16067.1 hypothetical protein GL4_0604 [Methyloceanibacter caenitepidi]